MAPEFTLVDFFEGKSADYKGRRFSEIIQWSYDDLESCHDYIQILFPLPERSGVSWSAPVIDQKTFDEFRSRADLQEKLRIAFRRILSFYGLEPNSEGPIVEIRKADNYKSASRNWVHRFDHNHLRITRILRSLRILGLEEEALAFYEALKQVYEASDISAKSFMFWTRAAKRPLNIPPDVDEVDEDERQGPTFLRDFEKSQKVQGNHGSGDVNEKL